MLFSRTNMVLMIPVIPLAASVCPMFAFVAPLYLGQRLTDYSIRHMAHMYTGECALRTAPKALDNAAASSGSPTAVPVP
jgi:hypothetical protein